MDKTKCRVELLEVFSRNKVKLKPLYKEVITKILSYKGKRWIDVVDPKEKEHTLYILELTKKLKPRESSSIDKIISDLDKHKFVYDQNNNWSFINKLNTNMSDAPIFILDLLEKSSKYDICKMLEQMKNHNFTDLSLFLNTLPKHSELIWDKFLYDEERYVQNIKKNSEDGDTTENLVAEYYKNDGWEIVHQGGNGDLVDMLLGIDLIVKKDDEYLYIQVKKLNSITKIKIEDKDFTRFSGDIVIMNDLSTRLLDVIAYSNTKTKSVFPLHRQNFYHRKPGDLVKYFGLPIPNKNTDFEVLIEN
jgi:hypothetical protein